LYSKTAISVNPDYIKAYYRLGQIYQDLGKDDESLEILEKGLEVAKKNSDDAMMASIEDEISKLKISPTESSGPAGGGFDLNSIMSNPMFANLASQMMSNPGMMESMLGGLGAGAGSAPSDPNFKETIEKMKEKPEISVSVSFVFIIP
jgi:small glutamine-rich tetratricopeptide repeat-containing protein alpha